MSRDSEHCDGACVNIFYLEDTVTESTLHRDVEKLRNAKQTEIRKLCKPWGVTSTAKSPRGTYPRRSDADPKRDIEHTTIERARELQQQI